MADVTDLFTGLKPPPEPSDAAKRIAEALNSRLTFCPWAIGQWMAFALEDGNTDGEVYEKKEDALRHHRNETAFMFLIVRPDVTKAAEMDELLAIHRRVYDAGFRISYDA